MLRNLRAGFQNIHDAMRAKADKLMNHPGQADDVYESKSSADKMKMRSFKKGGAVKKSKKDCQKFAMGGVAKMRLDQATKGGKRKTLKKKSLKGVL